MGVRTWSASVGVLLVFVLVSIAHGTKFAPEIRSLALAEERRALALLDSRDPARRREGLAVFATRQLVDDPANDLHRRVATRVVTLLESGDASERDAARDALAALPQTFWLQAANRNPAVVEAIERAVPLLTPALDSCDARSDAVAAVLERLGPIARSALTALVDALERCGFRSRLVFAVERLHPDPATAVPLLLPRLESGEPAASAAALALAIVADPDARANVVSAIDRAVERAPDKIWLEVLPRLGAEAATSYRHLARHGSEPALRATAIDRLAETGDADIPTLVAALGDGDASVREASMYRLSRAGRDAEPALPALAALAATDRRAELTLVEIGTPEAAAALRRARPTRVPVLTISLAGVAIAGALAVVALFFRRSA